MMSESVGKPNTTASWDDDIRERLRMIEDKLSLIIEILAPKESDGPTLDEILGRLVTLVAAQGPVLRHIDATTGRTLDIQEGRAPLTSRSEEKDGTGV
ncbi:MAG: hypothetical protein JJK57_15520 [Komagataeibacter hansenii]|uniref:Uncharacterized protein n=2 Tax=Acetobacteraceae TaxID=433 RepID=A0ABS5SSI0_9PROT|nr:MULTISPECIES: hypothetical protein [Komagataeibacter]MBL7237951.1 hypothetical protein [Novacetimonas hansenii]MBT0677059.1 hypothetical protein [Komagataeibacter oboediens]MBT0680387.1 hypothetical protein [Komagataeibacter oboediens]